jgi:hypothetical protein
LRPHLGVANVDASPARVETLHSLRAKGFVAAFEIRPRRATELVDASFQLLRRYYPQLVSVSAVAQAPGVFMRILFRKELSDPTALMVNRGPAFAAIFVSGLCIAIADAVLIVATSDGYLDGTVDLSRALSVSASRIISVLFAVLLRYLVIGIVIGATSVLAVMVTVVHLSPLLFVIVPFVMWLGIWVSLRTFAVVPAVIIEKLGPIAALDRTWKLSKSCTAHIFCSIGLAWLLYFVIAGVAIGVGQTFFSSSFTAILSALLIIPIYPLLAVVSTLLYYDLRIRKEGFDLEVMSRELGAPSAPPVAPLPAT